MENNDPVGATQSAMIYAVKEDLLTDFLARLPALYADKRARRWGAEVLVFG